MEKVLLEAIVEALRGVTAPRFFRSERGYHGRLYCTLQEALDRRGILKDGLILEMEYQKGARHRMTQRPDIILHVPAEESMAAVHENNVAVLALKRRASRDDALEDFAKLDEMCGILGYLLAVFVNVDSRDHHLQHYAGPFGDRLHGFAVRPDDGALRVRHAWRDHDTLRESEE